MQIVDDRRALHQIPELDRQLPKTMDYLRGALSGLKCRVFSPMASSLCAWFDFGQKEAIAFRADADALPITEHTKAPYASRNPGCMHACGHDGHMAILLELARRLDKKEELSHNVLLVFQCAEETTGGARDLGATGIFRQYHVEAIFGMHLWPDVPAGVVASRRSELMSRSCEITAEFTGRSAHIAKAEEGIDAMAAAVTFYRRVNELVDALPPTVYRLCRFGHLESGTVRNALSDHTHLEGCLRAFQDDVFYSLRAGLTSIGKDIERTTDCTVNIYMNDGYPAVINPPDLYKRVKQAVGFFEMDDPCMITEDFSWYQKQMKGMFFFLGVGEAPSLHSDNFDFDESVLEKGVEFFEELAEAFQ